MASKTESAATLTARLQDRKVSHVVTDGLHRMTLHFADGTTLALRAEVDGLVASLERSKQELANSEFPTKRQYEYLAFIEKYIARFGRSPAESDIARHFLVSAPTVNQMMQSLERRKFITRQPGVPRSIKISPDVACANLAAARTR